MSDQYDPRYLQGIAQFNDGRFFEAHELWEGVWTDCVDESRTFYQGLIQVAVCLHHFGNGNTRGARKLFFSSTKYLDQFAPWHRGVDLARLLSDMRRCLAQVVAKDEPVPTARLDPTLVPRIHFAENCEH
jgi:predicted metal-dependent hydrolase